jgi:hypothetical protein
MEDLKVINKQNAPKWIKVDPKIAYSTAVESVAKDFYEFFIEPFIGREPVHIDFGSISSKSVIKFIEAINKISKNNKNIIFVRKEVKEENDI